MITAGVETTIKVPAFFTAHAAYLKARASSTVMLKDGYTNKSRA